MRLPGMIMLILLLQINLPAGNAGGEKGKLTVIMTGITGSAGKMMVALSDSKADFEHKSKAFRTMRVIIGAGDAICTFDSLAYGEYAVKVYHDNNDNEQLDTNFLGIPEEDYGFSNNARGSFGPASWEDAKFMFKSATDTITIKVE
jgi:uncharacterized protein (DUF2141 family)